MNEEISYIFDSRWHGIHGIGRFAQEIRSRMPLNTVDLIGTEPVSFRGLIEIELQIQRLRRTRRSQLFFSPGYAPPLTWHGPLVFTIHDLIHVDVQEESSRSKTLYYNAVVRPAMARDQRVLTVSEYSRQRLLEWSGVTPEQVVVVGRLSRHLPGQARSRLGHFKTAVHAVLATAAVQAQSRTACAAPASLAP